MQRDTNTEAGDMKMGYKREAEVCLEKNSK